MARVLGTMGRVSGSAQPPSDLRRRIPNALTVGRLLLTVVFVVMLSLYRYPDQHAGLLPLSLLIFVLAAVTDALDGYLARRWNAVSVFGRVVDPAADKILVLGALILLASPAFTPAGSAAAVTGLMPWMVVVMLTRELMVTSIRAVLEAAGVSFAANRSGKLKMVLQSAGIPLIMLVLWLAPAEAVREGWARITLDITCWTMTLVTVFSSLPYAMHLLAHMAETSDAEEIEP